MTIGDIVYLNSGSPKLLIIDVLDSDEVYVKNLGNGYEEFSIPIRCLSIKNNDDWLNKHPEYRTQ